VVLRVFPHLRPPDQPGAGPVLRPTAGAEGEQRGGDLRAAAGLTDARFSLSEPW
jgi:hypothetical protein